MHALMIALCVMTAEPAPAPMADAPTTAKPAPAPERCQPPSSLRSPGFSWLDHEKALAIQRYVVARKSRLAGRERPIKEDTRVAS